jgi:predicted ATPase
VNTPFIGRREELGRLAELQLHAHRARRSAVSLIVGEPGTGKTALLAQVLDRSGRRHIRLVGFEPLQSVPLAAAAPLLRLLAAAPGPARDLDLLVFGGPEQESRDPLRVFEAAHRTLASSDPMLIAIDDLQWVDDLSLGLIHYLLQAAAASGNPLIVVAAARPSSAVAAFAAGVDAVVPADRRAHIELGPLALEEGPLCAPSTRNRRCRGSGALAPGSRSPFWLQSLVLADPTADPSG